jgi:vancomycin resistance protein VanJ
VRPPRFATPRRWLRGIVLGLAGLYAAGLALVLLLRVCFGDRFWWLALLNSAAPYAFLPLILLLPLAIALRGRVVTIALAALAVIGGLWFGPYFLPYGAAASALPQGPADLRVVSFNVWGNNPRLAEVEAWLRAMDADLVLLQEIPPQYAGGIPALADLYPYQAGQSPDLRLYGNLTLSRTPILQVEDFDLEGDGIPSQQRIVVEVPGSGQVAVYNVHLLMPMRQQARLNLPGNFFPLVMATRYDDRGRNAQITRLLARVEAESLPVLIGGDFNLSDQSVTYTQLASHLTDAFRAAGRGFGFSWPSAERVRLPGWVPPLLRIDYVWTSAAFISLAGWIGPDLGSDHRPVVIDLRQRGNTS